MPKVNMEQAAAERAVAKAAKQFIVLPASIDDVDWDEIVALVRRAEHGSKWLIGDIAVMVAKSAHYGEHRLEQLAADAGVEYSTLKDYRLVAERYPAEKVERSTHSWSVYYVFAGQKDRRELVGPSGGSWTVADARELVAGRAHPAVTVSDESDESAEHSADELPGTAADPFGGQSEQGDADEPESVHEHEHEHEPAEQHEASDAERGQAVTQERQAQRIDAMASEMATFEKDVHGQADAAQTVFVLKDLAEQMHWTALWYMTGCIEGGDDDAEESVRPELMALVAAVEAAAELTAGDKLVDELDAAPQDNLTEAEQRSPGRRYSPAASLDKLTAKAVQHHRHSVVAFAADEPVALSDAEDEAENYDDLANYPEFLCLEVVQPPEWLHEHGIRGAALKALSALSAGSPFSAEQFAAEVSGQAEPTVVAVDAAVSTLKSYVDMGAVVIGDGPEDDESNPPVTVSENESEPRFTSAGKSESWLKSHHVKQLERIALSTQEESWTALDFGQSAYGSMGTAKSRKLARERVDELVELGAVVPYERHEQGGQQ